MYYLHTSDKTLLVFSLLKLTDVSDCNNMVNVKKCPKVKTWCMVATVVSVLCFCFDARTESSVQVEFKIWQTILKVVSVDYN